MAFGEVGSVGGDFVGDDAVLHILLVRQAEVFLRRDIAEHGRAKPADHRRADARGDELIFINYSDGAPTNVSGCGYSYNGVTFTKKVIGEMREIGMNVISYFIYENCVYDSDRKNFKTMYGPDSQFIRPDSVVDIAKTINQKFLEIAK